MSQIFKENRPFKLNLYEAENPEYMLLNSFNDEYTEIVSPRILYWKLNRDASKQNQDKLDELYGEATQTNVYEDPIEVYFLIERLFRFLKNLEDFQTKVIFLDFQ